MANTVTGGYENQISSIVQRTIQKIPVFRELASFKEENGLQYGVSVNRPYARSLIGLGATYTPNTDVTAYDWSYTQSLLTIDQSRVIPVKVDPVENRQLMLGDDARPVKLFSREITRGLATLLDRDYLDEISNAGWSIDAGDFGGSALGLIDLSTTPIEEVLSKALAELTASPFAFDGSKYVILDSKMLHELNMRGLALGYNTADAIFKNGYTGKDVLGAQIIWSEQLPTTQTLTLSDVAVADDTFTIAGVTFTAKASPSAAGEFDIEGSASDQADTICLALNGTGTPGSNTYIELSAINRSKLKAHGITATNNSGTITITGYGRYNYAESLTNGAFGDLTVKAKAGIKGDTDMVVQMKPTIQNNKATNNLGATLIGHTLWGTRTFEDGAQNMCSILIKG